MGNTTEPLRISRTIKKSAGHVAMIGIEEFKRETLALYPGMNPFINRVYRDYDDPKFACIDITFDSLD